MLLFRFIFSNPPVCCYSSFLFLFACSSIITAADRTKEEQLFLYNIEGALRDAEDAQARENANSKIPPWAIVAFGKCSPVARTLIINTFNDSE